MNTYNITDDNFLNSDLYKSFMNNNSSEGYLKIRAYAASGALPIKGLKVVVSTIYENNRIIFFEGITDESGIIEKIVLPAPILDTNNLNAPSKTTYDISVYYEPDNITLNYKANIYADTCVVQNINIIPDMKINRRGYYGS